ncbi:MAG: hypothetical protein E7380_05640 [Clostridiales bacterium]|nr:hypothetical protein [Clostridiales bacterium]MBQ2768965.1 hypothetical protein [Clostridia bacterium]
MKKRIFLTILSLFLFCAFSLPPCATRHIARASVFPRAGDYACILTEARFCTAPDESTDIFLLPKTYYVKLLEYGENYCKIEYLYDSADTKKLTGYVKTSSLTFVDYVPARPYLYYFFDVTYRIDGKTDEDDFLSQITVTCVYYGDKRVGSTQYCYVLLENEFGYVPKPATLSFEENTEYADRLAAKTEKPNITEEDDGASPLQIAILVLLCLLVPVLAALVLKPPRRPPYENDE